MPAPSGDGGALCVSDAGTSLESSSLSFSNNLAVAGNGGAIAAGPGTLVRLQFTSFSGDSAGKSGGAAAFIKTAKTVASNLSIKGGAAKGFGGGLFVGGATSVQLTGTTIDTTTSGLGGGGIYLHDVQDTLLQDINIRVVGPVPTLPSTSTLERRKLLTVAAAATTSITQCSAGAGASAGAGPPGGGMYIAGSSAVAVVGSTITVGPLAFGWKGQGVALELDQASMCNSTATGNNTSNNNNTACSAVALLETRFAAPDGWEPGPLDRPLFASSLAGWSAQCAPQASTYSKACQDQTCSTPLPVLTPSSTVSSQSMLDQLRNGSASRPRASDLQNCLDGSLAASQSQLTSILLLPPVALGLADLTISNSHVLPIDGSPVPAIFPDSNSTFSLHVNLLDESGQLVTGMSQSNP